METVISCDQDENEVFTNPEASTCLVYASAKATVRTQLFAFRCLYLPIKYYTVDNLMPLTQIRDGKSNKADKEDASPEQLQFTWRLQVGLGVISNKECYLNTEEIDLPWHQPRFCFFSSFEYEEEPENLKSKSNSR